LESGASSFSKSQTEGAATLLRLHDIRRSRVRVGRRTNEEIAAAENRAEARRILAGHDLSEIGDDERERLNELLQDKITELPD
jgi:hypothetical protein